MSVKVGIFKKLHITEQYACSVLEVREWAADFADLRIEFGAHRSFRWNTRNYIKPKIQGMVIASVFIDSQLKPAISFYPIPSSKYGETTKTKFQEHMFPVLKNWLNERLANRGTDIVGTEMILVELRGSGFETHRLRYI